MSTMVPLILLILSIALNIVTLHGGHNWGDDFAQYIINAQNLLAGKPFSQGIMLGNPFCYPPGFAFLIAPLIKLFGVNFVVLKFLNIIFWYLSIFFLYRIFLARLGQSLALLSALVLAFSCFFFTYKQNVLSDIPFLFFIYAGVYLFLKHCDHEEKIGIDNRSFQSFLLLMVMACLIRTAGVILAASTILYLIANKRNWAAAGWVLGALTAALGIQSVFTGIHPSFFARVAGDPVSFFASIPQRASIPFESLFVFFFSGSTQLTNALFTAAKPVLAVLSPVSLLVLLGFFIYQIARGRLTFVQSFFCLYLIPLVFWTGFEASPRALIRITLPVAGFLLMSFTGFLKEKNLTGLAKFFLISLLFLNVFDIVNNIRFNDDVLFKKENQELFTWAREDLGPEEHYMFWEPRAMALMTGRVGTAPWTADDNDLFERIGHFKISYLVMIKITDKVLIQNLEHNPQIFHPVWENSNYIIFRIPDSR